MLYISDYIFSCYAFLFIFDFPNPLSKHILQFHAFLFISYTAGYKDCLAVIELLWKKSYQEKKTGLRKNKYILFRIEIRICSSADCFYDFIVRFFGVFCDCDSFACVHT